MPKIPSIDHSTPTMSEVIQNFIDADRMELNTCMPATVKSYDNSTQTCTVQPSMKRTTVGGEVYNRAEIDDVPVMFPRSGSGGIHYPIEKGDTVLLVFSQRSLDEWIDKGGEVELEDGRLHDITDAIAITGLYPSSKPISPSPKTDATELRGKKIFLGDPENATELLTVLVGVPAVSTVDIGGKVPLALPPVQLDLLTIIRNFLTIMENCKYGGGVAATGGGGPIDTSSGPALINLIKDIDKLKAV